ncbi:hypothetical protein BZA05DRAFT_124941 [Tricharina praecox]|uniref:uncharacterized protein n=1 Tax=Tricharina praecox TaxID=43433 RepID=UPI00221F6AA5|nr:uncharacterized protein BZA05DRAFT_124941 [Tricharina praecox]KAI5847511.1 hypothetical protein BZA05DRAFT_124941 [Tricharina praecox]
MNRLTTIPRALSRPSSASAFFSTTPPTSARAPPRRKNNGGRNRRPRKPAQPLRILQRTAPTYNPPVPAVSPLLNAATFLPYSKKHPKAAPTAGPGLSPREWALRQNPYAAILATPIRNDADFHRRLPAALLKRFVVKSNPATGEPWMLPDGLDVGAAPTHTVAGYCLATQSAVKAQAPNMGRGGKVWAKMLSDTQRKSGVVGKITWRKDMDAFVLMKLRRRVLQEAQRAMLSTDVDRVVGGEEAWLAAGEPMTVLDFREGRGSVEGEFADQDTLRNMTSAGYRAREPPPQMDLGGVMALVGGKRLPVHPMWEMLDEEVCDELRKHWRVEKGFEVMALMTSYRTLDLQVALMKLRYYLEMWFIPEGHHGKKHY